MVHTLDGNWRRVPAGVHQAAQEDGDVGDVAAGEGGGVLSTS